MGLPLYLATSGVEIPASPHPAFLMLDWEQAPPAGALPVITDCRPLTREAVDRLCALASGWERVVLDFEKPPTPEALELLRRLPCPAAAPPGMATGPVFLTPPLHIPLETFLAPWRGREIWLEAALLQQRITVTAEGTDFSPALPAAGLEGGHDCPALGCRFLQAIREDRAVFTLFHTRQTLMDRLEQARELGVQAALGLQCELGQK